MSFKTSLRTAHAAFRQFSTSTRTFQLSQPSSSAGPSSPSAAASSSSATSASTSSNPFLDLQNLLSGGKSTTASTPASLGAVSASASSDETIEIRRGYTPRELPPKVDPILDLFTNMIMRHGEKQVAQKKMVKVLNLLRETSNQTPLPLLHRAVYLVSPSVKVLNMRKSMKTVPTPRALNERQRAHTAIAWILKAAEKGRRGVHREERIARELLAVLEGTSEVFQNLERRHKEATLARSNIMAR